MPGTGRKCHREGWQRLGTDTQRLDGSRASRRPVWLGCRGRRPDGPQGRAVRDRQAVLTAASTAKGAGTAGRSVADARSERGSESTRRTD